MLCINLARLIFLLMTLWTFSAKAQTDLSGIINDYSKVNELTTIDNQTNIEVVSVVGFSVGDLILIIQMKGATIDTTDTEAFGTILDYNNCGNYEYSRIVEVFDQTIRLEDSLCRGYDVEGLVQIVRVPEYESAEIVEDVIAQDWNGTTGGIIAFNVSGTLTLSDSINGSGSGFRGGTRSLNPDGYCGDGSFHYFYPIDGVGLDGFWTEGGAEKGEGIASVSDSIIAGRGSLANGGGGGNKHNNGGGGGGNFTEGGIGGGPLGNDGGYCPFASGIGGRDLGIGYSQNKLFLGGGGGSGDDNNGHGTRGTDGGGIVLINAYEIIGNDQVIVSNGVDQLLVGRAALDGAGGGGGGGTIYLNSTNFTGELKLVTNGGDGGDQGEEVWACVGPGGGGGAGVIISCQENFTENVILEMLPGVSGIIIPSTRPILCADSTYGAKNGESSDLVGVFLFDECDLECGSVPENILGIIPADNLEVVIDSIPDIAPEIVKEIFIIEMPNVFTPNGDGVNDLFIPTKFQGIAHAKLIICNRWGQTIFVTDVLEEGWDGQFNQQKASEGVYFWIIQYTTTEGIELDKHGFFHLN